MIKTFLKKIKTLKTLSPTKETNKVFSELCQYSIKNDKKIKFNKTIDKLNKICYEAEYQMEKFWSEKIINSNLPKEEFKNFTYLKNYKLLTKLEFLNIRFFNETPKNVLFIWWWPLPLTAIILAKNYWLNCKIIDYSEEAINIAKKLVDKIDLSEKITFENKNILEYKDKKNYDLVYAASIIFWEEQEKILEKISSLNFKNLLVRTSHDSRILLYKKVEKKLLKKYFNIKLIVHPKNEIINSFIILEKK